VLGSAFARLPEGSIDTMLPSTENSNEMTIQCMKIPFIGMIGLILRQLGGDEKHGIIAVDPLSV
jgi:hypothetical protein